MKQKFKTSVLTFFVLLFFNNIIQANENFFTEGKKKYDQKKYDESKFLFQRNIIFNPKDAESYLFLAKIYNFEDNEKEEEKNLDTTLMLDPTNEEAVLMLMKISLKKSNYLKVKKLSEKFLKICKTLCKENNKILDSLKNIEPKDES